MLENYEDITFANVAGWIASGAIIFGGIAPYIPQYKKIKETQDPDGFSLYVCLTLLIANTLRILFWFGKHFELPLLLQSILMIITMFVMIKLCVGIRVKNQILKSKDRVFTDLDIKFFWKWTDFQSYLNFILVLGLIGGALMYLFLDSLIFVEIVGFLAVLTEAMLGIPQFIRNCNNKSTEGMSVFMVIMWTMGDTFKTWYFIQREAPIQFGICGVLQILIDISILSQVYLYHTGVNVPKNIARID